MTQGKRTITDKEILEVFENADAPFLVAQEVADKFGMSRQWAHNRLQQLEQQSRIKRKAAGERSVIWYAPED
jgi:DNA-binding Lrp family transcriptional regulator